jgi:hypothetical protein
MLNISHNINIVNRLFVILCSFGGDILRYQNVKYLFLTETAGPILFGVRAMQLFSEKKTDFTKLTWIFGRYEQIRDDYCNLCLHEVTLSCQL